MRGRRGTAGLRRSAVIALLGLGGATVPRPREVRGAVPSSYESPAEVDGLQLGRAGQVPPFGRGNGLDALFWTPLARVPADRVDGVLAALADEDVAAWAAVAPPARASDPRASGAPHDLWVAAVRLEQAQDAVMRVLRRA